MNPHQKPLPVLLAIVGGISMLGLLFWTLGQPRHLFAAVITVNTTADEYEIDGDCSLREAIAAANFDIAIDACTPGADQDEILFSVSEPAVITLTMGQLTIRNDLLTITGPGSDRLTITSELGDEQSQLFVVESSKAFTITGMTLRQGKAEVEGGAIYSNGPLQIADVMFIENSAGSDGGAIYTTGALQVQNSDFYSNTGSGEGGAVTVMGADLTVENSRFHHNHSGTIGGAVYVFGDLSLQGSEFISNTAQQYAGAVWGYGDVVISGSGFSHNQSLGIDIGAVYAYNTLEVADTTFTANNAAQNIGAVYASAGATLTDVTFRENSAGAGSTAAMLLYGSGSFTNTQWLQNSAGADGAALLFAGGDGSFTNALFATGEGIGAVLDHDGALDIRHATFVGPMDADRPALRISNGGPLTVQNSIFADHHIGMEVVTGTVSEDYNLYHNIQLISGTVSQGAHSYFGDPAFADAAAGDYHLSYASEAQNTGADLGVTFDLDGDARPGGAGIDLGYDESGVSGDLRMDVTAVSTPGPGQPVTYLLAIDNIGDAILPRLTITNVLPMIVTEPISVSSSVPMTAAGGENPYVWEMYKLSPQESVLITLTGVLSDVLPNGLVYNSATVASIAADTNPNNNSDSAAIDIPNESPVAVDDVTTILEDETAVLNPTANDIDGDTLSIQSFTTPQNGTAVLSGTQQLIYTPTLEFSGQDIFEYTVTDGYSTDSATITVTVTNLNDAPIITSGEVITLTIDEDNSPTAFNLTLEATDAENSLLTWSVLQTAGHGTAAAAPGPGMESVISYEPDEHYYGTDLFRIQASDGQMTDSITVNLTIEAVNDAPVAAADAAVVVRLPDETMKILADGSTGTLNVLDNDNDVEKSELTVTETGAPTDGGAVSLAADGALESYTPADLFLGTETFTYTVGDGELTGTAVVSMRVISALDGGAAGDQFAVPGLGLDGTFTIGAQIPASVAAGANFALVLEDAANLDGPHAKTPATEDNPGYQYAGLSFTLGAYLDGAPAHSSYRFVQPVTLNFHYPQAFVADIGPSEESLLLFRWDGDSWTDTGTRVTARDSAGDSLTVTVEQDGVYGLFRRGFVYLPMIAANVVQAPDLVVEKVAVVSAGAQGAEGELEIVIRNAGNGPVRDPFWVDLYLNPHTPPTAVNQTWQMRATQGLVWGVTGADSMLQPGETLTLTLNDSHYRPELSYIVWPLLESDRIYLQVDSSSSESDFGAVQELHEILGTAYNNIWGP